MDSASNLHALSRLASGFALRELVAEYRALRASFIQLWVSSLPEAGPQVGRDLVRFNEAIDQLLAESIASFADKVDASREYFLGILGHDLRSPLAAATLFAYLLGESESLDEKCREMAITLRSSLDAMNHLVRDILDFTGARLGAKMEVRPRPMDLLPLCHEVLAELRAIHPAHTFVFTAPDGDTTGRWDSGRLRQLISNLLGNAVQHGSATRPVTLTATTSADGALLTVHNYGPSLPEEEIGVIFEPLKRHQTSGPSKHHTPAGSVGLGLYIAREVANAHGGSITAASAGEETTFTVQLPRLCQDGA